jgi:hypothetical protein
MLDGKNHFRRTADASSSVDNAMEFRGLESALFCWSCFGLFQLVLAYSLSQNTIESAETSRHFHQPNQP